MQTLGFQRTDQGTLVIKLNLEVEIGIRSLNWACKNRIHEVIMLGLLEVGRPSLVLA